MFLVFETGFQAAGQASGFQAFRLQAAGHAGLELEAMPLPLSTKWWGDRWAPSQTVSFVIVQ